MAIVVKPAVLTDVSPCVVLPPQSPSFRTTAEIVDIKEADAILLEFCDVEKAVEANATGYGDNGQEKFILNWGDAKSLCYAILRAMAGRDVTAAKCLTLIDEEIKRERNASNGISSSP